jgi:hypothetical protein
MNSSLRIGQRVAAVQTPILAKHVAAGVTGKIVELIGYRAFGVRFDGAPVVSAVFPEDLTRISDSAPRVPVPPKQRGNRATGV